MASSKEFVAFVEEQLSVLGEIKTRPMMGGYLLYFRGKLVGDICDNRLLVKPVPAALELLPNAPLEPPYEAAKDMLLVEELDNRELLCRLLPAMYDQLPEPKKRKPKK